MKPDEPTDEADKEHSDPAPAQPQVEEEDKQSDLDVPGGKGLIKG